LDLIAMPTEVPTTARAERRDKIRNQAKVLAAAAELFAHEGVAGVTVDDIAARAGVGVGTIYRGFGDKGGLVAAILNERERDLQERILRGPPPLGPGAPPAERARAFLDHLSRLTERSYELLAVSENHTLGARYRIGSYIAWRMHLAALLRDAGITSDPELAADALLAPLAADLYRHLRVERQVGARRIRDNLLRLADRLIDDGQPR
jgi:AcrR family transcriptional regulator